MQDDFFRPPLEPSYKSLESIQTIKFTAREIDILSCMVSGRAATKTIASFLSIEPKTVEHYSNRLRTKLACSSRESIIDFIERAGKFPEARQHYLLLRIQSVFEKTLQSLSLLIGQKNILVIYEKPYQPFTEHLRKYFKCLRIHGVFRITNHLYEDLTDYSIDHCVVVASPLQSREILKKVLKETLKNPNAITCISFEKEIETNKYQEKDKIDCGISIHWDKAQDYYISFFEFFKSLFPKGTLDKLILEFKDQCDSFSNEPSGKTSPKFISDDLKGERLLHSLKKQVGKLLASILLCVGTFYILTLVFRANHPDRVLSLTKDNKNKTIRSDLPLPHDTILLKRPRIIKDIEEKLKGPQETQVVALVGIGGAGKTTLARQYARLQKSSVIWEMNTETMESLRNSFENLAYALCQTEEERKTLRSLQEIKSLQEKEEKILLFVKQKLKGQEDWILIFDNVEKFQDIQKYFPSDPAIWGRGKIILTTRDEHIKNNSQISHTVMIGELTSQEKLDLFKKITCHAAPPVHSQKEEEIFLSHLPPFPLDVSIAARYLEAAGISYEKYLEYVKDNPLGFEAIQENILTEGCTYPKTRYNIITLSIRKLIEVNKGFGELLLLISLIDSQNIPRELLSTYKGDMIVDNFIYHLKKYSLITSGSSPRDPFPTFSIHRSTQKISLSYLIKTLNLKEGHPLIHSISQALEHHMGEVVEKSNISKMKILILHSKVFLNHSHLLTEAIKNSLKGELEFIYFYLNPNQGHVKSLEEVLENFKKLGDKNFRRIAKILLYLGYAHNRLPLGDYHKAQNFLKQSLIICKKHISEMPRETARVLSELGFSYKYSGYYEKAKDILEESISIYKTCLPKDYMGISRSFRHLGNVYRALGHYEKAKNLFEESLNAFYKKYFPEDHIRIGEVKASLGDSYRNLGNHKKAKDLLKSSLTIYEKYYGKNHIETLQILKFLGEAYLSEGQLDTAESLLRRALETFRQNNHPKAYSCLESLADIYLKKSGKLQKEHEAKQSQDLKKQAAAYLNQAIGIIKECFPENCPHLARIQKKLKTID